MREQDKNNVFKTPKGYFEGFADKLLEKIADPDSYQDLKMSDLPKEDGFTTPNGYFEKLDEKIIEKKETKVVQLNPYKKYYFAAASIAATVLLVYGLQLKGSKKITFEDLASTDIENYLENNELGLSTYEIAEVLPVDELEVNDILDNKINEESIIDYLDENVDDFDELNLEIDE